MAGNDPFVLPLVERLQRTASVAASLLLAFALTLPTPRIAAAGKLDDVRREVREDDDDDEPGKRDSDESSASDDGDDDVDTWAGELVFYVLASPYWLPYVATNDKYGRHYTYARYPYADGGKGAIYPQQQSTWGDPHVVGRRPNPEPVQTGGQAWSLRLASDVSYQLDGIMRFTGSARFQMPIRFELESAWSYHLEKIAGGPDDALTIGDVNAVIRFAQSPRVQFHSGLGVRVMVDDEGEEYGFNFTYGFDAFPADPMVISASIDLGNLGNAFVAHGRATIGVVLVGAEIFLGYDHMQIGKFGLGGPVAGLRGWF